MFLAIPCMNKIRKLHVIQKQQSDSSFISYVYQKKSFICIFIQDIFPCQFIQDISYAIFLYKNFYVVFLGKTFLYFNKNENTYIC